MEKNRENSKKLFVFIGESGSGKTRLIAELVQRYPSQFKKIVTCTSRPMRKGEVDGIDYHFLPKKYFIGNPDLILTKKTIEGFHYGTRVSDLSLTSHNLLLTSKPTGIGKLVDLGYKNIVLVRISINDKLKIERMLKRGDSEQMILNRLQLDSNLNNKHKIDLGRITIIDLNAVQLIDEKIACIMRHINS